jgi:hypothetical protein
MLDPIRFDHRAVVTREGYWSIEEVDCCWSDMVKAMEVRENLRDIGCPTEVCHLENYRLKPITTKMFILAYQT